MTKGYWAWKKRFALFPTKMGNGTWIWLRPYYWRRVFEWHYRGPVYTRSITPFDFVNPDDPDAMARDLIRQAKEGKL